MMARDFVVTYQGRAIAGRVQLAGKVCGPASFIVGAGNRSRMEIDVGGTSYYVMFKPGRKFRDLEVGVSIMAVGQLQGTTLWVEAGSFMLCDPDAASGVVAL